MSRRPFFTLVTFICLVGLSGCIKSPLRSHIKLKPVQHESMLDSRAPEGITVNSLLLSDYECRKLLGIVIKNTQVIQITVVNKTGELYELHKNNINLELLPLNVVTQSIKDRNKTVKILGVEAACCVGFPLATGFATHCIMGDGPIGLITAATIGLGIIIGKTISGQRNRAAADVYSTLKKLSPDTLSIAPETTASMLLFIDRFAVTDPLPFDLCLVTQQNVMSHCTLTV